MAERLSNVNFPKDEAQDQRLRRFALGGPPLLAAIHVIVYVTHRVVVGTAPAQVPGEFYSLVLFLAGLHIFLFRRGASAGLQVTAMVLSIVSLLVAPLLAFLLVVMAAAA